MVHFRKVCFSATFTLNRECKITQRFIKTKIIRRRACRSGIDGGFSLFLLSCSTSHYATQKTLHRALGHLASRPLNKSADNLYHQTSNLQIKQSSNHFLPNVWNQFVLGFLGVIQISIQFLDEDFVFKNSSHNEQHDCGKGRNQAPQ